MKILQISDTHNRHSLLSHLPIADMIVHCGDFTEYGTEKEVLLKKKNTIFANGAVLDDQYNLREKFNLFTYRIIYKVTENLRDFGIDSEINKSLLYSGYAEYRRRRVDYVVFGYAVYSGGKIGIAPFWVHT